jgi:ABC-type Fe3+-hydroxamate transport system substrate-binding protein
VKQPRRVVSLVPSVTETLLAWGVRPVAVTRFCEAPGVVTVGGTKNPDVAAIVALSPDVVVMDKEENRVLDADALTAAGITVHVTHVRAVDDVAPCLAGLVVAVGLSSDAAPGRPALPAGADPPGVATRLEPAGSVVDARSQPRAWVPIWRRPWMSINAGTYGSSILAAAGIVNVCAAAPDDYPTMTIEEAVRLAPDVVLAPSEPYAFAARHRAELEVVAPVVFVDGQDLFWWGSRTTAALDRLRRLARALPRR